MYHAYIMHVTSNVRMCEIYIYIYIYIYVYVCIYIYIYVYVCHGRGRDLACRGPEVNYHSIRSTY